MILVILLTGPRIENRFGGVNHTEIARTTTDRGKSRCDFSTKMSKRTQDGYIYININVFLVIHAYDIQWDCRRIAFSDAGRPDRNDSYIIIILIATIIIIIVITE